MWLRDCTGISALRTSYEHTNKFSIGIAQTTVEEADDEDEEE